MVNLIVDEVARIQNAKEQIRTSIEKHGGLVSKEERIDTYSAHIDAITGGIKSMITFEEQTETYNGVSVTLDVDGVITLNGVCDGDISVSLWDATNLAHGKSATLLPNRRYVVMDASTNGYEFFLERTSYEFGDIAIFDSQGSISATTGLETSSTSYVRTPLFPVDGRLVMCTNTQKLKFFIFLYNSDGEFLERLNSTAVKYLEFSHVGYARIVAHHENWAIVTPESIKDWNPHVSYQVNHNGNGLSCIMTTIGYYAYTDNAYIFNNQYCCSNLIYVNGEFTIRASSDHWIFNVLLYNTDSSFIGYAKSSFNTYEVYRNHVGYIRINGRLATSGVAIETDNYMRNFDVVINKGWVSISGGACSVTENTDVNHMYIDLHGEAEYNNVRLMPGLYDLGAI